MDMLPQTIVSVDYPVDIKCQHFLFSFLMVTWCICIVFFIFVLPYAEIKLYIYIYKPSKIQVRLLITLARISTAMVFPRNEIRTKFCIGAHPQWYTLDVQLEYYSLFCRLATLDCCPCAVYKHQHGHAYHHLGNDRTAYWMSTDCRRHPSDIVWHVAVSMCFYG